MFFNVLYSKICQVLGVIKLFKVKSSKSPEISLFGLLIMQSLYIENDFSLFIEQDFIDTLESTLKLFKSF